MKQLLQNLKNGATQLAEVPAPGVGRGQILIASRRSLVSAGTERMLVDFGKAGWLEKARQQPEKVKQVIDKIRTDGLIPTVEAVFRKLDEPMPLGYCNVGVVVDVPLRQAQGDINIGDRMVSNGPHAEMVCVPRNLCAKIPDGVTDDEAAFTVLGAIALQGVRLAAPTLGEKFMVFGLGLVGLLTVQLLRASGCGVLAVDISPARLRLAAGFGAAVVDLSQGTDPVAAAMAWTGGRGVDGALIAASAKGDEIVHQAAQACRTRGRIVLVGVVDLGLRRDDFYKKELTFQVSCSYGPGRYDERYEQGGQDYPFGFVRWTEQRNFEAVLEAMQEGRLRVKELITHRMSLEEAAERYEKVLHDPAALGILIEYPIVRALDTLGTDSVQGALRQAQGDNVEAPGANEGGQGVPRQARDDNGVARDDRDDVMVSLSNHDDTSDEINERSANSAPRSLDKLGTGLARDDRMAPLRPLDTLGTGLAQGDNKVARGDRIGVGVIGAGNYARSTLLPALARTKARLVAVADINGVAAGHAARKFGAGKAITDYHEILGDPAVQAVFILVGHHLHARFVCEALAAGKHVFVEKPLAIDEGQLAEVVQAYEGVTLRPLDTLGTGLAQGVPRQARDDKNKVMVSPSMNSGQALSNHELGTGSVEPSPFLMVGFNRRFSPHTVKIRELLAGRTEPLTMTMTVNAGFIPPENWVQDPERGGGRIIGEGCHFIDLLSYLAGSPVKTVAAAMVGGNGPVREDKMSILLGFADGSVGTVHYFANGAKSYPKETLEVFSDGRVIRMENFRATTGFGFKGFRSFRTWRQDKGHQAEIAAFVTAVALGQAQDARGNKGNGNNPVFSESYTLIPFEQIVNITRASFAAVEAARTGKVLEVVALT